MDSRSTKRLALLISIVFLSISVWSFWKSYAATRTYTGASISNPNPALRNNLWSNPLNWSGNVLPQPGDDLVFGAAPQPSSNNFPSGTTFNAISIGGGHIMIGNGIALNNGLIATGGQISLASITLNNNQVFNAPLENVGVNITSAINLVDKTLIFRGPGTFLIPGVISGSGALQREDSGVTILTANNSHTGQTRVNSGTVLVNGSQPQSFVTVQKGGTLGGGGTVGTVVIQSIASVGSIPSRINPGNTNNGTAILNVGDVNTFNNTLSTVFEFDLKSATVGSGYDQLNVSGSVGLGAQPSTLQINLSFLPSPGTSFTIINNDGTEPVLIPFAGLPEGATLTANGITLVISYKGGDGNDVVLRVPQTKVWDGGGTTNNWSDAANWVGDVAPGFGDSLEFPAGAARLASINNFVANTVFNSITFSGGGYSIFGNGIALNAGINTTAVSGLANVIDAPIRIARPQSFTTSLPDAGLFINSVNLEDKTLTLDGAGFNAIQGVISGTGSIVQTGTGASGLGGANTYTGVTTIDSGRLDINGSQPNSGVNVFNGVLKGGGIVGPLVAFGGKVSPDRPVLTVSGNAVLHDSATLEINTFIIGTVLHGQLNVNGSVTITNSSLSVLTGPAVPTAPTTVIVSNDGSDPVVGTFAGLAEGAIITAGPHQFRISYVGGDGNDVVLVRLTVSRRWDGGSAVNSNWRTKENWEGDVAPIPGDSLEFPAGAARLNTLNDFPTGTLFNSVTLSGAGYSISGNGMSLMGGVNETVTSGSNNLIGTPITLNASQSFVTAGPNGRTLSFASVSLGDKTLTLDGTGPCNIQGPIVGSGSIRRRGIGVSALTNNNTYTGSTTIESGILKIDGTQPHSAVTLTNGTLTGGGTIGPLVATGGNVRPDAFSPLTAAGNVTLNQAVTLEIVTGKINNAVSLGDLKVNGSVNLGGSTLTVTQSNNTPAANSTSVIIDNDGSEPVNGRFAGLAEGAIITTGAHQFQLSYVGGDGNDVTLTFLGNAVPTLQFSTNSYSVAENATQATLTVFRTDNASPAVAVDYRTLDTDNFTVGCADTVNNQGGAFGRCDFATTVGTLNFAANETQKQILISIIDDVHVEGSEVFQVQLENPVGANLGTLTSATVTINANDASGLPNPIFQSPFFVRQHYLDFLSREPEPDGFNAWLNVLNGCPDVNNLDPNSPSALCDRIIVSQSFFGSEEFRIKGFYVFRFYKLAFNRLPEYLEIISDMSFVAGATPQEVFDRKAQLVSRFMQRQEFQTTYDSLSNSDFVNALMSRYQLTQITTPDPQQPDGNQKVTFTATDLANQLNAAMLTRAQVLRAIADSDQVAAAEFNNAFVATQYYGYLRRKPDPPGFNDWLQVLQSGNIRTMINGFMNSREYRLRFGPP